MKAENVAEGRENTEKNLESDLIVGKSAKAREIRRSWRAAGAMERVRQPEERDNWEQRPLDERRR